MARRDSNGMRFRDGKVVSMQDYRTEPEALAAVAAN
jgi:hypothetical protein